MALNILHLSQTDIRSDSRILKEMNSISKSNGLFNVSGIGVSLDEGASLSNENYNLNIYSINVKSRQIKYLPSFLVHVLSVIELTFKMLIRAIRIKPLIVHCNDTPVLPLGVLIKIITGAKIIYDAHELESNRNGLSRLSGAVTLFVEKVLWKFIDALIVVSPSIDKWYKKNIGDKYSEIILNSPVLESEKNVINNSYLRDHFSIPVDSKIFLYVGILGLGRGIDLITEVFTKPDIKSSLVFLGYGEMADSLKKISDDYPNIYFHDSVEHQKVVSVARSADVGLCLIQNVSLSDYYSLPNKLFEYSFAGIPVLASDFPDISQIVKKYKIGKCCSLNFQSIYDAIKDIEDSEDVLTFNLDDLHDLSWEFQEKKLIKLYANLM